jgi:hypothetical protein
MITAGTGRILLPEDHHRRFLEHLMILKRMKTTLPVIDERLYESG